MPHTPKACLAAKISQRHPQPLPVQARKTNYPNVIDLCYWFRKRSAANGWAFIDDARFKRGKTESVFVSVYRVYENPINGALIYPDY